MRGLESSSGREASTPRGRSEVGSPSTSSAGASEGLGPNEAQEIRTEAPASLSPDKVDAPESSPTVNPDNSDTVEVPEDIRAERESIWDDKRQEVRDMTDRLGEGVDSGIEETIVGLNLSEIPTTQSCEGHIDHGVGAPWVDVATEETWDEQFEGERDAAQQVAEEFGTNVEAVTRGTYEAAHIAYEEKRAQTPLTEEFQAWAEENDKLGDKLQNELDEFYAHREATDDVQLQVHDGPGYIHRLHNGGEDYEKAAKDLNDTDREALAQRLPKYQSEMNDFAEFLKEKFMSGETGEDSERAGLLTERYIPSEKQPGELLSEIQDVLRSKEVLVRSRIGDSKAVEQTLSRWAEQASDTDPENQNLASSSDWRLRKVAEALADGSSESIAEADGEIANQLLAETQHRIQETFQDKDNAMTAEARLEISKLSGEAGKALSEAHQEEKLQKTADMLERTDEIDRLLKGEDVVTALQNARGPFREGLKTEGMSEGYSLSQEELQERGASEDAELRTSTESEGWNSEYTTKLTRSAIKEVLGKAMLEEKTNSVYEIFGRFRKVYPEGSQFDARMDDIMMQYDRLLEDAQRTRPDLTEDVLSTGAAKRLAGEVQLSEEEAKLFGEKASSIEVAFTEYFKVLHSIRETSRKK